MRELIRAHRKGAVHDDPHYMVKIVWLGTLTVAVALQILLTVHHLVINSSDIADRLYFGVPIIIYLLMIILLFRIRAYALASWSLLILYTFVAIIILISWSVHASLAILMLGFVILLSGAMLGLKTIIPVTVGAGGIIITLHVLDALNIYRPEDSSRLGEPGLVDIATYVTMFGIFALITRLSGKQMENNLKRAMAAEVELEKEKSQLASRLREKTRILRKAQQEEIMQLYQFAELGQLTTIILHDLANNLSVLSLDIDDLTEENETSGAIARTKESIAYLERMVSKVRRQISKTKHVEKFDALTVTRQSVHDMSSKAGRVGITIKTSSSKINGGFHIVGDPLRLSQILTILINNAIDASIPEGMLKEITVQTRIHNRTLQISVIDHGIGVPENIRGNLFEPLHSNKQHGLGIGLFVAKQIAEMHFKGALFLHHDTDRTEFVIELPSA
ncbi:MAG: HAMP domain-containing sensor histidine kinase [Candidatus Microsaccharimonas sp.]|jgi:signal transduction histidine kinase